MATNRFDYPNSGSVTRYCQFNTAANLQSDSITVTANQITDVTMGGVRRTVSLGDNFDRFDYTVIVPVSSSTESDWDDIKLFFGSTYVNFAENSFVWWDNDGASLTVRMTGNLSAEHTAGTYKKVTMALETVNT